MNALAISQELLYLGVVVGLFIVPRVLQRFRIPSAITGVALGAALGMGGGLLQGDPVIILLSTLGIVALFLFAGMEVDFGELREGLWVTGVHVAGQLVLLSLGAAVLCAVFALEWRPGVLAALAIFTPSTGFIIDSLDGFGLDPTRRGWVKTKAIATELVALAILFGVVQSSSVANLGWSTLALAAMILLLPSVFHLFASRILPHAPKSEFAFLVILALICAYVTRHLGVYYLVGAFVVGVTAVRLRKRLPALASDRLMIGIELFSSFFIPFYFFRAGLKLESTFFTWRAALIGLLFVVIAVPLRIIVAAGLRRLALREPWRDASRVGLALTPTLVFALVLASILRDRYSLEPQLFGALVVYALVSTLLPGAVFRPRGLEVPEEQHPAVAPGPEGITEPPREAHVSSAG